MNVYAADSHLTQDDISHLNGLSIAFYIVGGLGIFFGLFPLIHVGIGISILSGAIEADAPPFVGWLFLILGLTFVALLEALAVCLILTGRRLKHRTNYTFCFVIACIACINVPIGTILGIFTIIVLGRPTVKAAFGKA